MKHLSCDFLMLIQYESQSNIINHFNHFHSTHPPSFPCHASRDELSQRIRWRVVSSLWQPILENKWKIFCRFSSSAVYHSKVGTEELSSTHFFHYLKLSHSNFIVINTRMERHSSYLLESLFHFQLPTRRRRGMRCGEENVNKWNVTRRVLTGFREMKSIQINIRIG